MTTFDRTIRKFLLRAIPNRTRILDVGCGTGWAALTIARERPGCTVHGADSDLGKVHRVNARHHSPCQRADVRCYPCTAEDLTSCFGRSRYDVVVSVHALHHYADPFVALRNMRGVVRRGGLVLITELDPRYGERLDDCPRFSLEKVVSLCEDVGLSVVSTTLKRPGVILVAAEKL